MNVPVLDSDWKKEEPYLPAPACAIGPAVAVEETVSIINCETKS
jgi:hypothetical protein